MSDSATDTERMRRDLEYLRERVDRLGEDLNKQMLHLSEELHKSRKTDWPAISAVVVAVMTVGSVVGGIAMSSITERIGDQASRIGKLEARTDGMRDEMEGIARAKVNALKDEFNKKVFTR